MRSSFSNSTPSGPLFARFVQHAEEQFLRHTFLQSQARASSHCACRGQSRAWGEERVFFTDPQTHQIRSLPLAWTSLALPDPFLLVAAGRTVLRFEDIEHLNQMLKALPTHQKEDH